MPYLLSSADPANPDARAATFDAEITPHDSLGRDGFALLVKIVLVSTIFLEGLLIAKAAWVVGVFLAFDVGGLLLAFQVLRSRKAQERIVITDGLVIVTQSRDGHTTRRALRVFGLALERNDDPDYGCQSLTLRLRGERVEIARDLSPAEREAFCGCLERALREAGARSYTVSHLAPALLLPEVARP